MNGVTTMSDTMAYFDFLVQRKARIDELVQEACKRAGRDAKEICVMAVSKNRSIDALAAARRAQWRVFGENRPQELRSKLDAAGAYPELADARFDMIGNLQTNKINQVLGRVALIHSISHIGLARSVSERSLRKGLISDVLLEVNVSGEQSKSGFSERELFAAADELLGLNGISIRGLMTMAPAGDTAEARRTFAHAHTLTETFGAKTGLELPVRSWGMSDDFEAALWEGSTLIRLGRCVFDENYTL